MVKDDAGRCVDCEFLQRCGWSQRRKVLSVLKNAKGGEGKDQKALAAWLKLIAPSSPAAGAGGSARVHPVLDIFTTST